MHLAILRNRVELLPGGLARVILTRGQSCLIDAADVELIGRYRWWALSTRNGHWYASTATFGDRKRCAFQMHQLLMGTIGKGMAEQVDHISGDTLDNRRSNLRVATQSQNRANINAYRINKSGFKGVHQVRTGKYVASIRFNKTKHHLGTFEKPEDAARAYNAKARELFGDFARLNAIPGEENAWLVH